MDASPIFPDYCERDFSESQGDKNQVEIEDNQPGHPMNTANPSTEKVAVGAFASGVAFTLIIFVLGFFLAKIRGSKKPSSSGNGYAQMRQID